jgi:hypothetical protein
LRLSRRSRNGVREGEEFSVTIPTRWCEHERPALDGVDLVRESPSVARKTVLKEQKNRPQKASKILGEPASRLASKSPSAGRMSSPADILRA